MLWTKCDVYEGIRMLMCGGCMDSEEFRNSTGA